MREHLRAAHLELGLEFPSTPEQIRGAYLKLLKSRKPDRDPEGFRRLRQAYEFLKSASEEPAREPEQQLEAPNQGPQGVAVEPLVAAESTASHASDELSKIKRRVAATLEQLRLDRFSMTEQIRLLDRVQQQFPHDPELIEWLASALIEAELKDEATQLLRESIQEAQSDVKRRLWRFWFSRLPESLNRYGLLNPPVTLEVVERLRIAELLVEQHREPMDALEALRRILAEVDADSVVLHSVEITRIILKVMHAGFLFAANEVGRLACGRVDAHHGALLTELIKLSDKLPPPATKQLAWVLLASGRPGLDLGSWDLAPHVVGELRLLLEQEAPTLRPLVLDSLPQMGDYVVTAEVPRALPPLLEVPVPPVRSRPRPYEPPRVPGNPEHAELGTPIAEVMRRQKPSLPQLLLYLCLAALAVGVLGWGLASL